METLDKLKIGTLFRKWDGEVCLLAEKSRSRAILEPGRREVALGCEVLEVLGMDRNVAATPVAPKAEGRGKEGTTQMSKETIEMLKKLREGDTAAAAKDAKKKTKKAKRPKMEKAEEKNRASTSGYKYPNPATRIIEYVAKKGPVTIPELKAYLKKTGDYNDKAVSNQICYAKRYFNLSGETLSAKDAAKGK